MSESATRKVTSGRRPTCPRPPDTPVSVEVGIFGLVSWTLRRGLPGSSTRIPHYHRTLEGFLTGPAITVRTLSFLLEPPRVTTHDGEVPGLPFYRSVPSFPPSPLSFDFSTRPQVVPLRPTIKPVGAPVSASPTWYPCSSPSVRGQPSRSSRTVVQTRTEARRMPQVISSVVEVSDSNTTATGTKSVNFTRVFR